MVFRIALRRVREQNARQRSDSIRRESIASAQMVRGSGGRQIVAASPEAVRSVWRPNAVADAQPLRWHADDEAIRDPSAEGMARRARRARQRAREAAVDVDETESDSPAPRRMAYNPGRRSRVMVDVASDHDGSVVDLTSTGDVQATGSDEEE